MKVQELQNISPKVLLQPLFSTNLSVFRGRPKKYIKNTNFDQKKLEVVPKVSYNLEM